jgi:ketosteroid isomerase-like protein
MSRHYFHQVPWLLAALCIASCTGARSLKSDLVDDPFPEAQAELRAVVAAIASDAMEANIEGLQAAHLHSEKFTKFGPRNFDRQDVASTNESEAAFFGSIKNLDYRIKDLKIDVFGDVGVVTYYPHVSFEQDGEEKKTTGRQTLVFLRTAEGWKIVHEHGTVKR